MDQKIVQKINHWKMWLWICRAVVILATGSSIWGNYLHSRDNIAAVIINIFPPIIIYGGFEILSHVPAWDEAQGKWRYFHPRRYLRPGAMIGITFIGAWLSYWHQKDAFYKYAGDAETAKLLPLAIDGLMIAAAVAVLDLNVVIARLQAYGEASKISTYKPAKENPEPQLPKPEKGPAKKARIVDYLTRYPEMPLKDIAEHTGSQLNYVYAVRNELAKLTDAPRELTAQMA